MGFSEGAGTYLAGDAFGDASLQLFNDQGEFELDLNFGPQRELQGK